MTDGGDALTGIRKGERFLFGENWAKFVNTVDDKRDGLGYGMRKTRARSYRSIAPKEDHMRHADGARDLSK
jgi:hypothetical protein